MLNFQSMSRSEGTERALAPMGNIGMTGRRAVSCVARRGACLPVALAALVCGGLAVLAANFPPLAGRIVDQANIIPVATRSAIQPKLADLESKSGIQLVVATVPSLEGEE